MADPAGARAWRTPAGPKSAPSPVHKGAFLSESAELPSVVGTALSPRLQMGGAGPQGSLPRLWARPARFKCRLLAVSWCSHESNPVARRGRGPASSEPFLVSRHVRFSAENRAAAGGGGGRTASFRLSEFSELFFFFLQSL